ncbi:MAG: CYTH domain-containing protein [Bacteroidia bacterium]
MSQNIEIEFKNILSEKEYELLLKKFNINEKQIFSQENHYFDTPDFALKEKKSALRIRQKPDHFEMTLKQPASVGLLETNQVLTKEEASEAIQFGKLPTGIIQNLIEEVDIPYKTIGYFGSLLTKRVEFDYKEGLLVLDHSYYLNKEDFELEYEAKNHRDGLRIFQEFLRLHGIPKRITENKILRFYNQKSLQNNTN